MRNQFMAGLLRQTPQALALQMAMWDSMSLWHVLCSKVQGVLEQQDVAKRQLEQETQRFACKAVGELQLMSLFRICAHTQTRLPRTITVAALEEIGDQIEKRAVALLRQNDKEFSGSTTQELVAHVLKRMFDDLSKKFDQQNARKQAEIIQNILASIKEMTPEQRDKLKEQLRISEFSEDAIRKALITGTLGAAFAVVVEAAGFRVYVIAAKMLAGIVGLIGLTLPFAFYAALSSTIAFLANPMVMVPAAVGLGWWLTKRTNRKIKDGLVPFMVTQAVVSSVVDADEAQALRAWVEAYNSVVARYRSAKSEEAKTALRAEYPGIAEIE